MESIKIKCPKCGYIFETTSNKEIDTCPLCSNEYVTEENIFTEAGTEIYEHKEKSAGRILLEWGIFGVALLVFIIILDFLFRFLATL